MQRESLDRAKECFLLRLLDETKRLIVARNVLFEQGISGYSQRLGPEYQHMEKRAVDEIIGEINASLLTALMVSLGYRIPSKNLYRLFDYGPLCSWLGEKEENGEQRWEEG
jgi:hypothetical protein